MTRLSADPDEIRAFAEAIGAASGHAAVARDYVVRYGDLPDDAVGLISAARGDHNRFTGALISVLSNLHNMLRASRSELLEVATYYATTNAEAAAAIDATYPETPRPQVGPW